MLACGLLMSGLGAGPYYPALAEASAVEADVDQGIPEDEGEPNEADARQETFERLRERMLLEWSIFGRV